MNLILRAEPSAPVTIYYCKAGVKSGLTVRVLHQGQVWQGRGVLLKDAAASMIHNNATGKPKASGARCVLQVTRGIVGLVPSAFHDEPYELEIEAMHALERDCLIFHEDSGQENRYFRDPFDRSFFCKCL